MDPFPAKNITETSSQLLFQNPQTELTNSQKPKNKSGY